MGRASLLTPEKQLSKGEAKCDVSKLQNHVGLFLCFAIGNLKCVVFYSLPTTLSVLVVTTLRTSMKEARERMAVVLSPGCLLDTPNMEFSILHKLVKFMTSSKCSNDSYEGGKYVGPKHHRKRLCQLGAEVLLIRMF